MDFGSVALAGAFLKPGGFPSEKRYPLTLEFCESCLLLQVGQQVRPETLFDHYFYFSSATETMRKHFEAYARQIVDEFHPSRVLEIGCNDGVLMRPLKALGVSVLGVDPARNVTGDDVISAYWGSEVAKDLGRFDLIVANNVFAHIEDINDAVAAVDSCLTEDGAFVFEVNRLDSMVADLQYDWIYHEHRYYYSLMALEILLARHGLEVFNLRWIGTHAGSIRYYAGKQGCHKVMRSVEEQRSRERWHGLDRLETFLEFAARADDHRKTLRTVIAGKSVAGYGACGRTNTMLQWCGFGPQDVAYIVDDAPAKQGFYTPGTHIPIVGRAQFLPTVDVIVVFAWSFLREIAPKLRTFHGEVVIPLPHVYHHRERMVA